MTKLKPLPSENSSKSETFNRRLYVPMILGSILNPVNSSMIAVSLIPIGLYFGAPPAETAYLVSALYIATAIGQPVVGRLVDMYGPRRLYLAGATLTGIAGLVGAFAPSLGVLIVARVILGFGTCAGFPAAMSLIRSEGKRTGHDRPATVLTILSIATQTIAVIGPTLGGLLIGLGGWRTIFTVNIPLALACVVLGSLRLPRTTPPQHDSKIASTLDVAGMALFGAMLISLMLFLMNPHLRDLYLVAVTLAAGGTLAHRELRASTPFIDLRVLGGNAPLLATYGRSLLSYTVSYAFIYGFTQWLESGRGLTASQTGLILLPTFLAGIVVASLTGRHQQVRGKLLVGNTAQLAACILLLFLGSASSIWMLLGVTVLLGIPQGLLSLANQNAMYQQADPARTASSAGLLRTFMYLGALVAAAATAAFFGARADTSGLHHLALFMVVVSCLLFALSVFDRSLARIGPAAPAPAGT